MSPRPKRSTSSETHGVQKHFLAKRSTLLPEYRGFQVRMLMLIKIRKEKRDSTANKHINIDRWAKQSGCGLQQLGIPRFHGGSTDVLLHMEHGKPKQTRINTSTAIIQRVSRIQPKGKPLNQPFGQAFNKYHLHNRNVSTLNFPSFSN